MAYVRSETLVRRRVLPRQAMMLCGLIAIVLCGIIAALLVWPSFSSGDLEVWVRGLEAWGPLMLILLMILHCFVPFPAELLAFCAGAVYGVVTGTAIVWVGAMLGAALSFGLARWLGREAVERILPSRYRRRLREWTTDQGAITLLTMRFIPVIAFNLINYAAGLTRVGWWTFLWTTALGILPLTALMVWLGSRMAEMSWPLILATSAVCVAAAWAIHLIAQRHSLPGTGD
ncbi:MAG: TVP38/TMEM64 family protein [Pseudomonadota bacterium]